MSFVSGQKGISAIAEIPFYLCVVILLSTRKREKYKSLAMRERVGGYTKYKKYNSYKLNCKL